jgi:hypothetical protein
MLISNQLKFDLRSPAKILLSTPILEQLAAVDPVQRIEAIIVRPMPMSLPLRLPLPLQLRLSLSLSLLLRLRLRLPLPLLLLLLLSLLFWLSSPKGICCWPFPS